MNAIAEIRRFESWYKSAPYGTPFNYHTGFLLQDRTMHLVGPGQGRIAILNEPLNTIARYMWNLSLAGKVVLAQRKMSEGVYEYLAFKRRDRRNPHYA